MIPSVPAPTNAQAGDRVNTGTHTIGPSAWPAKRNDIEADRAPLRFVGTAEAAILPRAVITPTDAAPVAIQTMTKGSQRCGIDSEANAAPAAAVAATPAFAGPIRSASLPQNGPATNPAALPRRLMRPASVASSGAGVLGLRDSRAEVGL